LSRIIASIRVATFSVPMTELSELNWNCMECSPIVVVADGIIGVIQCGHFGV
jgi:hypothetical protein